MFVENITDGFDARVRKLVYGFRVRLNISDHSLIETVINSSAWVPQNCCSCGRIICIDHKPFLLMHYCYVCSFFSYLFRWYFVLCVYTIYCMFICYSWIKYWKCSCERLINYLLLPLLYLPVSLFSLVFYFSMYGIHVYITLYIIWKPAIKTIIIE